MAYIRLVPAQVARRDACSPLSYSDLGRGGWIASAVGRRPRTMAKGKGKSPAKPGAARAGKPKHSNDANRPSKGSGGQRDASTVRPCVGKPLATACMAIRTCDHTAGGPCRLLLQVRRLKMYKTKAIRDKKGHIIHEVRVLRAGEPSL